MIADAVVVAKKRLKMGIISAKEYQLRMKVLNQRTLEQLANEVIVKDEATIRDLKEQDFLQGDIYGDDYSYATYRSQTYASMKYKQNPLANGKVDLVLTGRFVKSLRLKKPVRNRYQFYSRVPYASELEDRYGKIFGLNQKVFDKYQKEILRPRFVRLIKNYAKIS